MQRSKQESVQQLEALHKKRERDEKVALQLARRLASLRERVDAAQGNMERNWKEGLSQ